MVHVLTWYTYKQNYTKHHIHILLYYTILLTFESPRILHSKAINPPKINESVRISFIVYTNKYVIYV